MFVDDGSSDATVKMIEERALIDKRVILIELSRNFGKELALSAGIDCLNADAVIIMDADLQHPPSYIPELIRKWGEGYEIVATKRVSIDNQPLVRRLGSFFFYKILNSISEFKMVPGTTDFRLIDRIVIDALKTFREKNRMVRGLIDWMGFKKAFIDFKAPERNAGVAGYSYMKLVKLALNSLTSFSLFPLKVASYLGLSSILVFSALLCFMCVDKLWMDWCHFSSISFIIVANVVMNGIMLSCIGFVAFYIGNIHAEAIDRPLYLIRKKTGLITFDKKVDICKSEIDREQ
jgi:dolichol-phosphate mannosyltransferase